MQAPQDVAYVKTQREDCRKTIFDQHTKRWDAESKGAVGALCEGLRRARSLGDEA